MLPLSISFNDIQCVFFTYFHTHPMHPSLTLNLQDAENVFLAMELCSGGELLGAT